MSVSKRAKLGQKHTRINGASLNMGSQCEQWYVAQTRSNFEKRIASELALKGVHAYLPCLEEVHRWKDRSQRVSLPLFSGYVFVRITDSPESRLQVLASAGVVRLLGSGANLEPVLEAELNSIRLLLASSVPCQRHPFLRAGDPVRIKRGPLKGCEGYLDRSKNTTRLVVSVSLLSRSVSAELDVCDIDPILRSGSQFSSFVVQRHLREEFQCTRT